MIGTDWDVIMENFNLIDEFTGTLKLHAIFLLFPNIDNLEV